MKKILLILLFTIGSGFLAVDCFAQGLQRETTAPAGNPPPGFQFYYTKSGSSFCTKNSSGVEFCTGTGTPSGSAGGDLTGSYPNPTVAKVNGNTPGGTCTNQVVTALSTSAAPTCTTVTSAYVDNSIALTGADINTSNQITATHLVSALPINQGGTGTETGAAQNSVFAGPASGGSGAPSFQTAPTIAVTNMTGTGGFSTTGNAATATAVNFSGVASSTNTTAAMVVGSGASLAPTGTGTILASNVTPALSATGPVTLNQNFTAPALISNGVGPWTSLTERANAITPAAGFDICDQDSTAHGILCSFNGDTASLVVRESASSTNTGYVFSPSASGGIATPKAITNTMLPNGLSNFNTSNQTTGQLTAATPVYIAGSNLLTPATLLAGYTQGTTWTWRVSGITKDANGTGALTFLIYAGTNGTTADAALATQAWGTAQTAVIDVAEVDVTVTITGIVTGTATVYWTISPTHHLAITGFCTTAVGGYSGTATFNTATAGLIFGLGIQSATGGTMETLHINAVQAHAYNLS